MAVMSSKATCVADQGFITTFHLVECVTVISSPCNFLLNPGSGLRESLSYEQEVRLVGGFLG